MGLNASMETEPSLEGIRNAHEALAADLKCDGVEWAEAGRVYEMTRDGTIRQVSDARAEAWHEIQDMEAILKETPVDPKPAPSKELQLRRMLTEYEIGEDVFASVMDQPYETRVGEEDGGYRQRWRQLLKDSPGWFQEHPDAMRSYDRDMSREPTEEDRNRFTAHIAAEKLARVREVVDLINARLPDWATAPDPRPLTQHEAEVLAKHNGRLWDAYRELTQK